MSKLIKFFYGNGNPILINPDFIQEVTGSEFGSVIVVKGEENGEFVKHRVTTPINETIRLIEEAKQ